MLVTDKYLFFYGSIYSQWYMVDFVLDGYTYNCAEQRMMHKKALLFGDKAMAEKIMASENPHEQKMKYGRNVANFVEAEWNKASRPIVTEANVAKFSQNPRLLKQILETGDRIFVEASPTDKIWGIGLREDDPRCLDPKQWRGTNWLGECLMEARAILRAQT